VGGIAGKLFAEAGALVVAVQDHTGGVANDKGLAVPKLLEHVAKTGGVAGFKGGEAITSAADFWACECDILMPAAGRPDHQGQRRQDQAQDGDRRRQRPHHPRGRRHPARQGRAGGARRHRQRRRRDGELLRVGAGLLQLLLDEDEINGAWSAS
jgi:hypothetical protein